MKFPCSSRCKNFKLLLTKRIEVFTTTLLFIFLAFASYSQNEPIPGIKAIACVKQGEIIIRWSPTTPVTWEYGNQYGYTVEKYLVVKNGKALSKPVKQPLTNNTFKPKPLEDWRPYVEQKNNKYAAIAAQALYGKTFRMEEKNTSMAQMINKAKESENRFGFAMFSAAQSAEVAGLMGVRWVDQSIIKGEKYLYRVYANVPGQKIDTGFVFVDADKITPFVMPREIQAVFADKTVKLTWDHQYFQDTYSGYFIERSEDKTTWQPRNKEPYMTVVEGGKEVKTITFIDSIPENGKTYYYRIKGKNFFAELSESSTIAEGQGRARIPVTPKITSVTQVDKNKLKIDYGFPVSLNARVKDFRLYAATTVKGPYKLIKKVDATERSIIYDRAKAVNYLTVGVMGKDSLENKGMPVLFQLEDVTPPVPPVGINGNIDTNGVVTITWNANKEEDFYGYRIFKANKAQDEFANITSKITADTVFKDTITLKTLTKKIYYKLTAMDNHFNSSTFSGILELSKPDIVAPSAPVFSNLVATDTAIFISWINSIDEDVVGHVLYRSLSGANEWKTIAKYDTSLTKRAVSYTYADTDKSLDRKSFYDYAIIAVDNSGNESPILHPVRTKLIDTGKRQEIQNITASVDRENQLILLTWKYPQTEVDRFLIYRKGINEPLKLYKAVEGTQTTFTDKSLKINSTYSYVLRAQHKDGGSSPFSKEVNVSY